jgi:hypothetical protein
MSDDQISLPYLLAILVVSGLVIRYMFFAGPSPPRPARSPEAFLRSREIAVDRIQQMFPQADRRSILWDLQRNGGNIQTTTERILSGRLDTVCRNSLCLEDIRKGSFTDRISVYLAPCDLPAATSSRPGRNKQQRSYSASTREARAAGSYYPIQPQEQAGYCVTGRPGC